MLTLHFAKPSVADKQAQLWSLAARMMKVTVPNLGLVLVLPGHPCRPFPLYLCDLACRLVLDPVTAMKIPTCPLSEHPEARPLRVRSGVSPVDVP